MQQTSKTFPAMLKLISGALIGGVNYEDIYMDSEIDDKINPPTTTNNMGLDQNTNIHKIPNIKRYLNKLPLYSITDKDVRRQTVMEKSRDSFCLS
jgi:hypothetical protein